MRGIKTLEVSRQSEGLLAWHCGANAVNSQRAFLLPVPSETNGNRRRLHDERIDRANRVFLKCERRAQAYEAQRAYQHALSMYEQLLTYAHEEELGLAERDRCVGAIMRCVAASSSALLF